MKDLPKMKSKSGSNKIILQGEKLYKFFRIGSGVVEVIKGVDISINAGDFLILFGSSGCGKSTLLNMLLGLEHPSDGKVNFMNKDIYSFDEDQRSQIRKEGVGFIYQQQNWIKALNVLENVSLPLTLSGVNRSTREDKAFEMLKMVKMGDFAYQAPTELSSGQQQKISYARALIADPTIVVADEPTGNLDSKSSVELMNMFQNYNELGHTIIMVTHDLGFLPYATRSINMSDGVILKEYKRGDEGLKQFVIHKKDYAERKEE